MRDILMTAYVLVWPLIVLVTMVVMGVGVYRDARAARRKGQDLV
ncbi:MULTISPECIES: putative transporter small subunit [unclassified Lysobacter]